MITNRYNYTRFERVDTEQGRRYLTPDGDKLPSVTTILDYTKSEEKKEILKNWRDRVGHKQAQEITTEAASRGTRMHKYLENYLKNGKLDEPGSNPYSKQSNLMAKSIIDLGFEKCNEFWGSEINLYFPKIYAGTTDLVGLHENVPSIMDYKQTNKPKKREWIEDYFIQLCAYAECHNELYNTNISRGVVFMCSADNIYQEFLLEGSEFKYYTNIWWKKVEEYYTKAI